MLVVTPIRTPIIRRSLRRREVAASVVAALLLVGCNGATGDGEDAGAAEPATDEPTATGGADDAGGEATTPASADADAAALFDGSVVHEVTLGFEQTDYDAMIETLAETGEKEWIEVTVTIDGVTYERAGARLKGNSSLAGLAGGGPGGLPLDPAGDALESAQADRPPGGFGGGGPAGSASADSPEDLPWLIRLDRFVEGQEHQGYADIVIRSNGSAASLNEAVALDLLEEAGLASQRAASTRFSVNGGTAMLRLMIEHPDDGAWQRANFDGEGALYKAESTGDWSYRGDDPAAYDEVFDQEGGSDVADLTPLVEFLAFIDESDEATFAAELPQRLDVEAFATYLAMMDLVDNFDDIDGPGNNAYLWWDAASGQFTVVPWDMNLAFGGLGGGFGGAGGLGGPGAPGDLQLPEGFEPPDGFEPPKGFEPPEGAELPDGFEPGAGPGGPGAFSRSNPLVERFHATAEFEAMYQQQLDELTERLFDSGAAEAILAAWTTVVTEQASDLVDASTIEQEAAAISQSLAE